MVGHIMVLSLLVFLWLRSLPGGTVSAMLGERATPQTRAALSRQLGLDQPIWVQYVKFVGRMLHGKFGPSNGVFPGHDAFEVSTQRLPATLELSFFAIVLAVVI